MKIFLAFLIVTFFTVNNDLFAQNDWQYKRLRVGVMGGFGRQKNDIAMKYLLDGTGIKFDQSFIKSFKLIGVVELNKKYAVGLEVGFSYDYDVAYTVRHPDGSLGVGQDAGTGNGFTIWHASANLYRKFFQYKRFCFAGYVGVGLEIFPYDNYYKETTIDPHKNPHSVAVYTHQPSVVNHNPIIFFNAGLEVHYSLTRKSRLTLQPALYYGTKAFLKDYVDIKTATSWGGVQTPMTGTRAMLSLGYSYYLN